MSPIGTAAISAALVDVMKSSGTNCGMATNVPHHRSFFSETRVHSQANRM